jgi:hypothetical protein
MAKLGLIGRANGPGIAACVLLKALIEELVRNEILAAEDVVRILDSADSTLANMGVNNIPIQEACKVMETMRAAMNET